MEPPPEEQQGIAAILNQAQQAGPTIANNQAAAQQQQLVDQAANKAAPAAAQMLQQNQQPKAYAQGGLTSLPAHMSAFKEGGVIGFSGVLNGSEAESLVPNPDDSADAQYSEATTSRMGDLLRKIFPLHEISQREKAIAESREQIRRATPGFFEQLTDQQKADRAKQLEQAEKQYASILRPAAAAVPATIDTTSAPKYTVDENGVAHPIGYATPQELAAEKRNAPRSGVVAQPNQAPAGTSSSKVSMSTREKIGGPTEPEKSGIASIVEPSVKPIDMTESQRIYDLHRKAVENKPDFEARGLADIAAMQQRDKDTEAYRRYAAIAGARRPGINAGASMMAASGAFVEAQNAKAYAADGAKTALGKAAYAESIGDLDGLAKAQDDFNRYKEAFQKADEHLQATIYATKMGSNTSLEVANMRAEMSERIADMRVASALNGRTANLKDPSYVADKISDNVSKQMEELQKNPRLGINIKTAADWMNLRRQLTADEVVFWKGRGADVSGVNIGGAGQTAEPATGKLDFANIGK
jgi:hypothetical protein